MIITTKRMVGSACKGDVIDYTRFRLGGNIVVCPKCGQKGQISRFKGRKGEI